MHIVGGGADFFQCSLVLTVLDGLEEEGVKQRAGERHKEKDTHRKNRNTDTERERVRKDTERGMRQGTELQKETVIQIVRERKMERQRWIGRQLPTQKREDC